MRKRHAEIQASREYEQAQRETVSRWGLASGWGWSVCLVRLWRRVIVTGWWLTFLIR